MYENRFMAIKRMIPYIGFDEYYQAGSVSVFHKMNIVATSRILNLQYWICVSGGYRTSDEYYIAHRPLDNSTALCERIVCRNQKELCAALQKIKDQITAARQAAGKLSQ